MTKTKSFADTLYACEILLVWNQYFKGISKYYIIMRGILPSPDSIISGIYDVVKFNQHLIVCGHFEDCRKISVFLENQQYMPGGGTDGIVYRLLEYNNLLYAEADLETSIQVPAMSIASHSISVTNLFPCIYAGIKQH